MVKVKVLVAITILMVWSFEGVIGDPQLNLLTNECSAETINDLSNFNRNLNASFAEMRAQVTDHGKYFATAQSTTGTEPVYAMFQCMNYLSTADCAACFDAAAAEIRHCTTPITNGARVVYDGCFLRYENNDFFGDNSLPGNSVRCGNQTAVDAITFNTTIQQILQNLQTATPKIKGFFATTKTQVADIAIYAVAQCAETFTQDTCSNCLSIQHNNLQGCLPNTNSRAIDPAGCFTRYSETPFFADNQTTDISPFLNQGGSSSKKKWVVLSGGIGGVVGGVILVVILLSLFSCHKRSQSPKRVTKGYMLGETELKAPTRYKYGDLKAATKNFSENNKLGEGGFGTVYKVLYDGSEEDYLLRQAWKLHDRGNFLELVDKTLNPNSYDANEVKKVLDIALLCTQASPAVRPAMSAVVVLLNSNNLVGHMRPSMPIFIESKLKPHKDISASTSSSMTNATTSNSIVPAR
ncbi:hypothetical protein VNO78_21826 [Psophocarpus tetragonolobus]|uniref:Gnk2-homologous domain-containing protein n=1 Tax=Psophocarpus tetragonolobus TaxID=3891 RepID=A0AAN9SDU5_PSOTE